MGLDDTREYDKIQEQNAREFLTRARAIPSDEPGYKITIRRRSHEELKDLRVSTFEITETGRCENLTPKDIIYTREHAQYLTSLNQGLVTLLIRRDLPSKSL